MSRTIEALDGTISRDQWANTDWQSHMDLQPWEIVTGEILSLEHYRQQETSVGFPHVTISHIVGYSEGEYHSWIGGSLLIGDRRVIYHSNNQTPDLTFFYEDMVPEYVLNVEAQVIEISFKAPLKNFVSLHIHWRTMYDLQRSEMTGNSGLSNPAFHKEPKRLIAARLRSLVEFWKEASERIPHRGL